MNLPEQNPHGDSPQPWEHHLHAELRRLPELTAPPTLVENVMAIVRARETLRARPWWRRPVTLWPPVLRIAFGVAGLLLFATIVVGVHLLWPDVRAAIDHSSFSAAGRNLAAVGSALRSVLESLAHVMQSLVTPTRLAILAAVVFSQVLLLGAGTTALRAALRAREPRGVN